MAPDATSPSDRISAAVQRLIPAAAKLQGASEDLSKPVSVIDSALKNLNLGVASWTTFHKAEDQDGDYGDWSLGYARHDGRWGLLVRLACGNRRNDLHDRVDTWFFNDAPRFIKTRAALPELIEGLVAVSEKTADKLIKKVPEVTGLAAAVTQHFEKRKK